MPLSKIIQLKLLLLGVVGFLFVCCENDKKTNKQPNIILIMSDDMGYSDLGCYGGIINTPVLDGLAQNGLSYTQFYNAARCCPTRASLLTGLHPHQAGIGYMMQDRGRIPQRLKSFSKTLNPAIVKKKCL
jgi:arylsulfatase A-like enzyme